MIITAVYGFNLLKWLNYISVPTLTGLLIYGLSHSLADKNISQIFDYTPQQPMNFVTAIAISIGFIAVGGVISPDYNRYAASTKDAVIGSILGIIPGGLALMSIGGILSILQESHDIIEIFSTTGIPLIALSTLIIATWTTNVVNAYSGGLGINQAFFLDESKRGRSTLIAGLIGTCLAAFGFLNNLMEFLQLLTATIPPIAGIILADYWIVHSDQNKIIPKINFSGILAWISGVALTFYLDHPIKTLLAIVSSIVIYVLLVKISSRTK